ncbi:NfeD family protein [bacterium]|nr:NfeD family protein [bacterium]
MTLWKAFLALGFLLLILELITPATFFLSLAIGSFVTGICAVFIHSFNILIPVFVVVSILSLLLFRPFLRDNLKSKDESGIDEKYIGKTAKVLEKVTKFSGVITIYGERWEARISNGEEIPENSEVKIVRNESLIMYVESL